MAQTYYNQSLSQGVTPNFLPVLTMQSPIQSPEERSKHLCSKIPHEYASRLHILAAIYILFGILELISECVLAFQLYSSLYVGFLDGILLSLVGVTILVLCRQEIYALTTLTVVLIFQLACTLATLGVYSYGIHMYNNRSDSCSDSGFHNDCDNIRRAYALWITNAVLHVTTFFAIILNFVIISNVREPPRALIRASGTGFIVPAQSPPPAPSGSYIPPSSSSIQS